MKIAIASFAKTIGHSKVKTRLGNRIEVENAKAFYCLSVECVREVLEQVSQDNPDIFPHWALADEGAVGLEQWKGFPNLWTGEGELGTRLHSIANRLFESHDCVFLMGTDSPHLSGNDILDCIRQLQADRELDHLAAPATDGGFWLWGSRKRLAREVWEAVEYSLETTLSSLITKVEEQGDRVKKGHAMQDVDELEDLLTLEGELKKRETDLLPAQSTLLKWLQDHNPTFQV